MSNFVRVKEGFGKIEDSRIERFSRVFFVKGASFEGWYDEREIEGNTSVEDENMELTFVEDDEMEEDPIPRQSSLFTEEFIPFGTVSAAEFDPYLAQDDEEIENPAPEVLLDPEEAPVVEFDEAAEPAEDDEAKTAAWRDVQRKAKRLRDTGSITVEYVDELMITGQVQGDNGTYATAVYRGGRDLTDRQLSTYKCSCKWGNWVYRRGKYFGRLCSHSLAMFYEMQASDRKRRRSSSLEREATASDRWPEILELVKIHSGSGDYWGRDEEFWEPIGDFADEIGLKTSDVIEIAESTLGIEASTRPRVESKELPRPDLNKESLTRTADDASDIARSWYQNSTDEELLNLNSVEFTRSLKSDGVDPEVIEDVWWELQDYIDRNIRFASSYLSSQKKEAETIYACPQCGEPVVESYGGWRDCPNCGWKETSPVDLQEYAGDFDDDFDYWASTASSIQKESVVGREAFYGGTTVIIREILSNNRVAVSYPEDDSWFVVMDEDLYSQDSSAPWGVEASYVEERISGENPGLEYADALVGSEGMQAYAADEADDDSDEDDNGDTASDPGDSADSSDDSSSGDSAEEESTVDEEETKESSLRSVASEGLFDLNNWSSSGGQAFYYTTSDFNALISFDLERRVWVWSVTFHDSLGGTREEGEASSSEEAAIEAAEEISWFKSSSADGAKPARRAGAFSKEAGKSYSLEEQQALIDEDGISHDAINSLKLEGTHYINDELILP